MAKKKVEVSEDENLSDVNEVKPEEAINDKLLDHKELQQFLTFCVDDESYGVDLLTIREIKGWTETTRLPNSPSFMKGVINLRGAVIPIFDLKGRFSMGVTNATEKHVVIILAVDERLIGILVDSVSDIIEVEQDEIKQAPQMDSKIDDKFVNGLISIKDKMVVVLDIDNLFDSDDITVKDSEDSNTESES